MTAELRTTLGLDGSRLTIVRSIAAQIAADNSTLTDTNIPLADALDCRGFESIFVGVEIFGGASPTCALEPLFYDEGAVDGARWWRMLAGSIPGVTLISAAVQVTPALVSGQLFELFVHGWRRVYLRRTAVTNDSGTTAMKILAMPGRPRNASGRRWP
jgi:hypothetical protein